MQVQIVFGQFWPLDIVIACVCLSCVSVCPCVRPEFVHMKKYYLHKLEPPNSDKICKTPWLSSLQF